MAAPTSARRYAAIAGASTTSGSFVGSDFAVTNPNQTFKDARSKVQWAKRHIYKLIDEYNALFNPDLTRLIIEDDFEPGQQRVKAVRITEFHPASR
jgi:hypothetical protein